LPFQSKLGGRHSLPLDALNSAYTNTAQSSSLDNAGASTISTRLRRAAAQSGISTALASGFGPEENC
jgi:hypothetical protein